MKITENNNTSAEILMPDGQRFRLIERNTGNGYALEVSASDGLTIHPRATNSAYLVDEVVVSEAIQVNGEEIRRALARRD